MQSPACVAAEAAATEAAARLTDAHWSADSLIHDGDLDTGAASRRLGVPRPRVLEMLAEVEAVRRLAETADGLRQHPLPERTAAERDALAHKRPGRAQ